MESRGCQKQKTPLVIFFWVGAAPPDQRTMTAPLKAARYGLMTQSISSGTSPRGSLAAARSGPLSGEIVVPGDKSMSHRALMIAALAQGETQIAGLLEGDDVLATARALGALGVTIERKEGAGWSVRGLGIGGLKAPEGVLDLGNSGTGVRLLMGILATHPFTSVLSGDASLSHRPMARVSDPLSDMGAGFDARDGSFLPLTVHGTGAPVPIEATLKQASAQVKSAILLAALNTPGLTRVIEPKPTRDHTETMLAFFGAHIKTESTSQGGRLITIEGQPELTSPGQVTIPGDISSAAFALVAGLVVPGSKLTIRNIGLNPLRTGLLETLLEMGGDIKIENERTEAGEPVGDIVVHASDLKGVNVPAARAPTMIDEYPILAVAAACARGQTRMEGVGELRVKESDRIKIMAEGLRASGVMVDEGEDWFAVQGQGEENGRSGPKGGACVATHLDHRIAMSFLILGLVSENPISVDDATPIATSFPGFADLMAELGAKIGETV